jgi:hypothetical protein
MILHAEGKKPAEIAKVLGSDVVNMAREMSTQAMAEEARRQLKKSKHVDWRVPGRPLSPRRRRQDRRVGTGG